MNNLLLWDIDGTLLKEKRGKTLIEGEDPSFAEFIVAARMASERDDLEAPRDIHDRTDYAILSQIFEDSGYTSPEKEKLSLKAMTLLEEITLDLSYIRETRELVQGAGDAVASLSRECLQTYATGNSPLRAQRKLQAFSLNDFFDTEVAGFGSTTTSYSDFVEDALRFSERKYGQGLTIFLLGNTPNEIKAAQQSGIRSIGVSAGAYSEKELAEHKPGLLLNDFTEDNFTKLVQYIKRPEGNIFQQLFQ